jgi:hypothetical protein
MRRVAQALVAPVMRVRHEDSAELLGMALAMNATVPASFSPTSTPPPPGNLEHDPHTVVSFSFPLGYIGPNRQTFSSQSRTYWRPKHFYCRPRPAAQLLPFSPANDLL